MKLLSDFLALLRVPTESAFDPIGNEADADLID